MKLVSQKELIENFINGSRIGIQTTKNELYDKLAIYENTLILITKTGIYPILVRLSPGLMVKFVGFSQHIDVIPLNIYRKCRDKEISVMLTQYRVIERGAFETDIRTLQEEVANRIGDDLVKSKTCLTDSQAEFKRQHKKKTRVVIEVQILKDLMKLDKQLRAGEDPEHLTLSISTINASHRIIQQADKYLQVCITIPEFISPGIAGREDTSG